MPGRGATTGPFVGHVKRELATPAVYVCDRIVEVVVHEEVRRYRESIGHPLQKQKLTGSK